MPGDDSEVMIQVRCALLDALQALDSHREAVVVVGAQAVYLHTGQADVALAASTKDSDLALDQRLVADDPLLEQAMKAGGFSQDLTSDPGAWLSPANIPVDLMIPEALAGPAAKARRGGRIPPHDKSATRRAVGLEAAVVDHSPMDITALGPDDHRTYRANVAGPAALLVAKLHKLGERQDSNHKRLRDKDAHDVYRLLRAVPTHDVATPLSRLLEDPLAGDVTRQALVYLQELFADGPHAVGSTMAGRAEKLVGEPETVAASVAFLSQDILADLTA